MRRLIPPFPSTASVPRQPTHLHQYELPHPSWTLARVYCEPPQIRGPPPQHPSRNRRLAITQQMPPAFLTVTHLFVSVNMCEASPHFACGASPERPRAGESIVEHNHHTHHGLRHQ
jgi:hypothetical protein